MREIMDTGRRLGAAECGCAPGTRQRLCSIASAFVLNEPPNPGCPAADG